MKPWIINHKKVEKDERPSLHIPIYDMENLSQKEKKDNQNEYRGVIHINLFEDDENEEEK